MSISQALSFFRLYLREPAVVGAVAPSSRFLAARMAGPFAARQAPARVLEVGAGTGAFTRAIGAVMGPDDHLDVCELQPQLADVLEANVLTQAPLADGYATGRVRLLRCPVQEIDAVARYDYVVCGLPFTAFPIDDIRAILDVIERALRPGGVFSYFEYVALRSLWWRFALGRMRRERRAVSQLMTSMIRRHQIGRDTVWRNLPPAWARHWVFQPTLADDA